MYTIAEKLKLHEGKGVTFISYIVLMKNSIDAFRFSNREDRRLVKIFNMKCVCHEIANLVSNNWDKDRRNERREGERVKKKDNNSSSSVTTESV